MNAGEPPSPEPHGVLVVDKPRGPTSHDVVGRVRRLLRTRRVGHAGTLDPAASGVLVMLIGEATKLGPYLTAHDKRYEALVRFGRSTTTLDAEGETLAEGPLPLELEAELRTLEQGGPVAEAPQIGRALALETARTWQEPPSFSAIKLGGQKAYDLARRGVELELEPRPVEVRRLEVLGAHAGALQLEVDVAKGYYVRSLARDLGRALQVPAHLETLRRTSSGPFSLDEAASLEAPPTELRARLLSLEEAVTRALPSASLTAEGEARARVGKRLRSEHFQCVEPQDGPAAWLSTTGELLAIGHRDGEEHAVLRGFPSRTAPGDVPVADAAPSPTALPEAPSSAYAAGWREPQ